MPLTRIYQKTTRGQQVVKDRGDALPAGVRSVLIVANGRDNLGQLKAVLGTDAPAHIETLLHLGLVEAVVVGATGHAKAAAPKALPTPVAQVTPEAPASARQAGPAAGWAARPEKTLSGLKRQAVSRLAPQFGPDVDLVCADLLAAGTPAEWGRALAAIEAKLAIYLGSRQARQLLADLRP